MLRYVRCPVIRTRLRAYSRKEALQRKCRTGPNLNGAEDFADVLPVMHGKMNKRSTKRNNEKQKKSDNESELNLDEMTRHEF